REEAPSSDAGGAAPGAPASAGAQPGGRRAGAAYTLVDLRPPATPAPVERLSAATRLAMYRAMVLVRALDTKMVILQRQGRISFFGPITGQEAGAIGAAYASAPHDWAFPALRESAVALVRGLALEDIVAQCFGN